MNSELQHMTADELGRLFPIFLSDYNPEWPEIFEKEKKLLLGIFKPVEINEIFHIGSTAIPGIKAKPTIDILFEVPKSISDKTIIDKIKSLGYDFIRQPDNPPPHMFFPKGYTTEGFKGQAYHIHVRYPGFRDEVIFRNCLRNNPKSAKAYEELKIKLSYEFKNDRDGYTDAKTEFVNYILRNTKKQ